MIDKAKVEVHLSNKDRSLRDINMGDLDSQDVENFLKWYMQKYEFSDVMNEEGECLKADLAKQTFLDGWKTILRVAAVAGEGILIKNLNCHIFKDSEDIYEIELDFSPDNYSYGDFIDFMKEILDCTKKREYYVKHENVGWKYGDTSDGSGVIFSHKDVPL